MCQFCDKPLNQSLYQFDNETESLMKSCPHCSEDAGYHVFYPAPEMFGCSTARINSCNPTGIQSHCKYCRSKRTVPKNAFKASCMTKKHPNDLIFQQEFDFRV